MTGLLFCDLRGSPGRLRPCPEKRSCRGISTGKAVYARGSAYGGSWRHHRTCDDPRGEMRAPASGRGITMRDYAMRFRASVRRTHGVFRLLASFNARLTPSPCLPTPTCFVEIVKYGLRRRGCHTLTNDAPISKPTTTVSTCAMSVLKSNSTGKNHAIVDFPRSLWCGPCETYAFIHRTEGIDTCTHTHLAFRFSPQCRSSLGMNEKFKQAVKLY